jgi:hypothetical protein
MMGSRLTPPEVEVGSRGVDHSEWVVPKHVAPLASSDDEPVVGRAMSGLAREFLVLASERKVDGASVITLYACCTN